MAKLFPNKLSGAVAKNIAHAFQQLKKLPDAFSVWYHIKATDKTPQFLIIWENRCAYLLHITSTAQELVDTAIHGNLFDASSNITPESIGEELQQILATFTQKLPDPQNFPLQSIVAFPNVNNSTLDTISPQLSKDSGVHFLGKQQLTPEKFAQFLIKNAPTSISEPQIIQLRHHFTPEVTIPARFSPLTINRALPSAPLAPLLLDIDQEWCMKNNLYLPEEAQALANNDEPNSPASAAPVNCPESEQDSITCQLVTGVAGSGKSLILLYRALLNAQLNPDAEILILTHNRPIINELQARFDHLSNKKLNITWLTFFQWARKELNHTDWDENALYPNEIEKIIDSIIRESPENKFTTAFLVDEFGFIKDHQITNLSSYQALERKGQKRGLNKNQRQDVWEIFERYQKYLKEHNKVDWHNVAMRFHKKAMAGKCRFPRYHCILIDEAQFFAKAWFDIVKKALMPGGQLFLSADSTQGFLKRRQSWISSGLEVRGRTTKLKKAYRSSREILRFAANFYLQRQSTTDSTDEELNLPNNKQIRQAKSTGIQPLIIPTTNYQDTNNLLIQLLKQIDDEIKQSNTPTAAHPSILILHADSNQLSPLVAALNKRLPHLVFHNIRNKRAPKNTFAQLATLNAATGLESCIVFLLGIDSLLGKESSPLLDEDERSELIQEHTRLLYMGFTRAAQKLIIFSNYLKNHHSSPKD